MAHSTVVNNVRKQLIRIDVCSDTVCPWCFVGKKNLDKAIDQAKEQFDFEIRWHPFFLDRSAPKKGIPKLEFYKQKFGAQQCSRMMNRMSEVFQGLGLQYDTSGLTGNTLDSHRLISFAAKQGYAKQNSLVEELFLNYFVEGKYIGDRQVLMEAARKAGIQGAAELPDDPSKGLDEVNEDLEAFSSRISSVPHYLIDGRVQLSGGQPAEVFLRAFKEISKDKEAA